MDLGAQVRAQLTEQDGDSRGTISQPWLVQGMLKGTGVAASAVEFDPPPTAWL